jgi:hypothetical protein
MALRTRDLMAEPTLLAQVADRGDEVTLFQRQGAARSPSGLSRHRSSTAVFVRARFRL